MNNNVRGRRQILHLQLLKLPLAGFKSESVPIEPNINTSNFPAEINMFTAWDKNILVPLPNFPVHDNCVFI